MFKGRPINFCTLSREECKSFGQRLSFARTKLGITQGELARRAGCTREYINMIESNKSKKTPNWKLAKKLADVVGESLDWLTENQEE